MSALTLVMKELAGMDAEEFVNVRAYHGGRPRSFRDAVQGPEAAAPAGSESSGLGSSGGTSSEDEQTSSSPFHAAIKKANRVKPKAEEDQSIIDANYDKQLQLRFEKNDAKIIYGGRNILNLERNLQVHQWQLTSPLATSNDLSGYSSQLSSFRYVEESGGLEELTTTCRECYFKEPIQF